MQRNVRTRTGLTERHPDLLNLDLQKKLLSNTKQLAELSKFLFPGDHGGLPNACVGPGKVERTLGSGKFGTVLLVHNDATGQARAVKLALVVVVVVVVGDRLAQ